MSHSHTSPHFFGCNGHHRHCNASTGGPAPGAWWKYILYNFKGTSKPGVDKTPQYLSDPFTPVTIRALIPSAVLLVLLREPGARAYSHFHHVCHKTLGRRACQPDLFDRMLLNMSRPRRVSSNLARRMVTSSFYLKQLRTYWAVGWDCHSMWIGLSEMFYADPNHTVNAALTAIGFARYAYPTVRDSAGHWKLTHNPVVNLAKYVIGAIKHPRYPPMLKSSRQMLDHLFCGEVHDLAKALPSLHIQQHWGRYFSCCFSANRSIHTWNVDAWQEHRTKTQERCAHAYDRRSVPQGRMGDY